MDSIVTTEELLSARGMEKCGDACSGTLHGKQESMCAGHQMRVTAQSQELQDLQGKHPCFSFRESDHQKSIRLHLPVSPGCNISCAFCKRDNQNESEQRPGVARRLLMPNQAVALVEKALAISPDLKVVGIAGPGDPLFTDHAVQTFSLLHKRFPHLIKCVSTNGLMLPDRLEQLVEAGVKTLTVTVNSVNPEIQEKITPFVLLHGKHYYGEEGAGLLIQRQLDGIRNAAAHGIVIKINTVLIPGLNEGHIGEVARCAAEAGATLVNIIPLIPQHNLASVSAPTAEQVKQAKSQAALHLNVFGHCKRCRADAFGVPGLTDLSSQLYGQNDSMESTFSHG